MENREVIAQNREALGSTGALTAGYEHIASNFLLLPLFGNQLVDASGVSDFAQISDVQKRTLTTIGRPSQSAHG